MPSKKPKLVIYTDDETIKKLDIIARKKNRSRGNLADTIIKEYLNEIEVDK